MYNGRGGDGGGIAGRGRALQKIDINGEGLGGRRSVLNLVEVERRWKVALERLERCVVDCFFSLLLFCITVSP